MKNMKNKPHLKNLRQKEKVCFFTVAYDETNKRYAKMMLNSLRKFHPDVDHHLFTEKEVNQIDDPNKAYRLYALFGRMLAEDYDLVIQIDADSIVTGSLQHILDDSYDLGCVLNNNRVDPKLSIYDVDPGLYVNAGFVAVRGKRVWDWWNKLNHSPYFDRHRFREQDMLNIMFNYGDLKSRIFDFSEYWHGLIHKGEWHKMVMRKDQLVLPKSAGVAQEDKIIKIIHWAGGNVPKMNFHVHFTPAVVKYLEGLTK